MNSPKHWKRWEATRQKGLLRFVLLFGVIRWGLCTAVTFFIVMRLINPWIPLSTLPIDIAIFAAGGVLWGVTVWYILERKYRTYMQTSGGHRLGGE